MTIMINFTEGVAYDKCDYQNSLDLSGRFVTVHDKRYICKFVKNTSLEISTAVSVTLLRKWALSTKRNLNYRSDGT